MTIDAVRGASNTAATETEKVEKPDGLAADKETFLKLLVAQLQHQNPLEPMDGAQFVTQLAQFTALEHSASMREDLGAIRVALEPPVETAATEDSKKSEGDK